jgi:hypothetical protein
VQEILTEIQPSTQTLTSAPRPPLSRCEDESLGTRANKTYVDSFVQFRKWDSAAVRQHLPIQGRETMKYMSGVSKL